MARISELEESKEEAREEGREQVAIGMLKDNMPISKLYCIRVCQNPSYWSCNKSSETVRNCEKSYGLQGKSICATSLFVLQMDFCLLLEWSEQ